MPIRCHTLPCRPAHLSMELQSKGRGCQCEDREAQLDSLAAIPAHRAARAAAGARRLQQHSLVHDISAGNRAREGQLAGFCIGSEPGVPFLQTCPDQSLVGRSVGGWSTRRPIDWGKQASMDCSSPVDVRTAVTTKFMALQALIGGTLPARNPVVPAGADEGFEPPPAVFPVEGSEQKSFPLALAGAGR
jgi:hypothetical protein